METCVSEAMATAGCVLSLAAISYLILALWRVLHYRECPEADAGFRPAVTVLKPLCGDEPGLYFALRSFCLQDYGPMQLVFGLRDARDPALAVVDRLKREFPHCDITTVIDPRIHGTNLKVSNLINMMAVARHPIIVISDSDVGVGPDCLASVVSPMADPRTGAVTCLYKGIGGLGLAARLGAMYINDWFLPSVLVDIGMNGIDFCFGPVTAVRREALEAAGGFAALADYLADDHRLGRLITRAGYAVKLSSYAVNTMVGERNLATLLSHEVRWARTVRACRATDHLLSVITYPLPLMLVLLLFPAPTWGGAALIGGEVALRIALHFAVRTRFVLAEPYAPWLLPLREMACFAVWAISLFRQSVRWRDRRFVINQDGRMVPEDIVAEEVACAS